MNIVTLCVGLVLIAVFGWLLVRNSKRWGFVQALFSLDIIVGIVAGIYLTFTSIIALLT